MLSSAQIRFSVAAAWRDRRLQWIVFACFALSVWSLGRASHACPPHLCPPCLPSPAHPSQNCEVAVAAEQRCRVQETAARERASLCDQRLLEAKRESSDATDRTGKAEARLQRAEEKAAREEAARTRSQLSRKDVEALSVSATAAWTAASSRRGRPGLLGIPGLNMTQAQLLALVRLSDESLRHRLRMAAVRQLGGVWHKGSGELVMRVFPSDPTPYKLRVELQGEAVGAERVRVRSSLHATGDGFTINWVDIGQRFASFGEGGVSRMELFPDGTLQENGGASSFVRVSDNPAAEEAALLPPPPPPPRRRWRLRAAADVDPRKSDPP